MVNIVKTWLTLILILQWNISISQKKTPIDSTFYRWPSLSVPRISPDGRYIMYIIENSPINEKTLVVKSTNSNWTKTIVGSDFGIFDAEITNNRAICTKGSDSICVFDLGEGLRYIVGYSLFNYIESGSNDFWISLKGDSGYKLLHNHEVELELLKIDKSYFVASNSKVLIQEVDSGGADTLSVLKEFDLSTKKINVLWSAKTIRSLTLDEKRSKAAWISQNKAGKEEIDIRDFSRGVTIPVSLEQEHDFKIEDIVAFNSLSDILFLKIRELSNSTAENFGGSPKIWSYNSENSQIFDPANEIAKRYYASIPLNNPAIIRLGIERDDWFEYKFLKHWKRFWLISHTEGDCDNSEAAWNPGCHRLRFLINLSTGHRKELPLIEGNDNFGNFQLSPDEKYIVCFDYKTRSYLSLSIEKNTISNIFNIGKVDTNVYDSHGYYPQGSRGIAGWGKDGKTIFIYDQFDIWRVDLTGSKSPENITKGYGRNHQTVLSFITENNYSILDAKETTILSGFNVHNKDNGFLKLSFKATFEPIELAMGPYIYYMPFGRVESDGLRPIKAASKEIFVVRRESAVDFPNYFTTEDFVNFKQQSFIYPEKHLRWMFTELHSFELPDGRVVQGVLYKPEDFDSTKRYPIIFNVYERQSNALNSFIDPEPLCNGCAVNPAVFINNGYLVFKPDIYYKPNLAGKSALVTCEAALDYFKSKNWVDLDRVGLQGCSFGGFEANYIVTHSKRFKAVCSSSGISDLIGMGSTKYNSIYRSFSWGQVRMDTMLWENPHAFIENSPIFSVDRVTAPVLLFHTSVDDSVPFNQAISFYLMLRRLRKPAWLLEYAGGNHGVYGQQEAKDFSRRMLEFFNHYLRGEQPPNWMNSQQKGSTSN